MTDAQLAVTEPRERVVELTVGGDIDMATVGPLRDATRAAAASGDCDLLVIDLLGVDFLDSSGLHLLSEANRAMIARGGRMQVICASGHVLKLFEITGLDKVLSVFDGRDSAYSSAA